MENNQGQGAFKSKAVSYRTSNHGRQGGGDSEEGRDAVGELRRKMIMRQTAADDVNELAADFIKLESNNQGASKSKFGSYQKINIEKDGGGGGGEEGKDAAGELRKKTVMRQTAVDVNYLDVNYIKMENNQGQSGSKSKVDSHKKINNGKGGSGGEEGKDATGELRKKTIMRQTAVEDVNNLAVNFIKMENNQSQSISKSKDGSYKKINTVKGDSGGVEGKDATGELRKKTIMRQLAAAEDVNELADDFIKNFRKQLKIERADSIKRFREMIDRGT